MAKIIDLVNNPDYKRLSELVMGTADDLRRFKESEISGQRRSVGRAVTSESFQQYENELINLINQIKAGQKFFTETVSGWDKSPYGGLNFPDMYSDYRKMIYELKKQKQKVEAQQVRMLEEKRAAEQRSARPAPAPRTPAPAPAPKKANWWKRAVIGTALVAGGWFGAKQMNSNDGPKVGDQPNQRMEQRVGITVARQGAVYTAMATQESGDRSLLGRLQTASDQSMSHPSYVTDDATFNVQVKALQQRNIISGLDVQGSANQARIAGNMASTAASKRSINYSEQRMKVDTAESWEDTTRAIKYTTRNVKETTQEINGLFNGALDMFKRRR